MELGPRSRCKKYDTYISPDERDYGKGPSKIEWDLTNGPRSVSCD